jgi:hypothetical protein
MISIVDYIKHPFKQKHNIALTNYTGGARGSPN